MLSKRIRILVYEYGTPHAGKRAWDLENEAGSFELAERYQGDARIFEGTAEELKALAAHFETEDASYLASFHRDCARTIREAVKINIEGVK